MALTNELLKQKVDEVDEYVRKTRGYLHEYPETSGKEFETSKFLQNELTEMGYEIEMVSTTGFIVTIETGKPGKTIALRADIDALPMPESDMNLVAPKKWVSKNEGACHACGHDAHMAMLLGTTKVIDEIKSELSGTILLCFEEGEEIGTGWPGMMEALSKKKIDAIWGIHVTSFMPTGTINIDAGPRMAGVSAVEMDVIGKGGHGSRPDLSVNPVFGAANILIGLGTAWPNRIDAEETVTLGLATIHGGTQANIIPDKVTIGGTIRFFSTKEGEKACDVIRQVSANIARAHNCEVQFSEKSLIVYNPVVNDDELANMFQSSLSEVLPEGSITHGNRWFASESFREYSRHAPSILAFLGIGNKEFGSGAEHHNVHFDIDEDALKMGVLSTVKIVVDYLSK
ncbi:amidohydrolase [Gudongella oleilytica]|uniref:amidohydrolase n=1 Tax=Gudongella oleilytica TaxID=1582259 RepID=UPI002A36A9EA|nr:amidohydrolase [Gudongella oleilytica]MDY0257370.1 amidohydrolase [Gudongella oleilytica]